MAPPIATDDSSLLTRYAARRDSSAFTDLVRRHLALVHSSASRRVGDPHLAEDITQAVFLILSHKAPSIPRDQPLSAWLLTTTRYAASNAIKLRDRRRRQEESAAIYNSAVCSHDPSQALLWNELASHLDDAVLHLPSIDRRVILIRYFEERPIRDIASLLNTTEAAIKQRLSRALDKLRARLDRFTPGILPTSDSLSALLLTHTIRAAPSALIRTALTQTLTTTSTTHTLTIAKGAMKMMTWTKAKIAAALIAAFALTGTTGVLTINHALAESPEPVVQKPADPPASKDKKTDNYLGIVTPDDAPPVVVEASPRAGSTDVDPATTELKVTFSKDMQDKSWSWAQISDSTFPKVTSKPHYEADHRTCTLPVKLEPNHTYILQLNYPPFTNFTDTDHRQAVRYLYVFQTRS
jgi:RNA polymerase sigma-70 factor (ECF subfamily)